MVCACRYIEQPAPHCSRLEESSVIHCAALHFQTETGMLSWESPSKQTKQLIGGHCSPTHSHSHTHTHWPLCLQNPPQPLAAPKQPRNLKRSVFFFLFLWRVPLQSTGWKVFNKSKQDTRWEPRWKSKKLVKGIFTEALRADTYGTDIYKWCWLSYFCTKRVLKSNLNRSQMNFMNKPFKLFAGKFALTHTQTCLLSPILFPY